MTQWNDAAQRDRVESSLREPLHAKPPYDSCLITEQVSLVSGSVWSNPLRQYSLWEETGVPRERPRISVERCSHDCATEAPQPLSSVSHKHLVPQWYMCFLPGLIIISPQSHPQHIKCFQVNHRMFSPVTPDS